MRRSDFESYRSVILLGVGPLERATGLDESTGATIAQLKRRSIWFILALARLVGRPIVDVLVAVDGNAVAGTGTLLWLPKTAYVAGMVTRPEARGQGIASRILAAQNDIARRRHREWLALDVESENEPALRVYRKAGYREVGESRWYTRTGLSPDAVPAAPGVRPVGSSDWRKLAERLDASRPEEYRAAFPARPRLLHHNEILVRGGRVEYKTWWMEPSPGSLAVLRAYYIPGTRMGALFPLTTIPEPSAAELAGLFGPAMEWLRARDPRRSLAVAPAPRGGVGAALEEVGFSSAVSSRLMIRPVAR